MLAKIGAVLWATAMVAMGLTLLLGVPAYLLGLITTSGFYWLATIEMLVWWFGAGLIQFDRWS